jgi:ABC-2 type transport system permease protein
MKGFYAIFRKETASFFVSPIAYAVIATFLLITGFLFRDTVAYMSILSLQAANNPMIAERINPTEAVIQPLLQTMAVILLFVIPLLTMRLVSEEKKSGTIELLLTYPVTDAAVLAGKFLAAGFVLLVMLAMTFAYPLQLYVVGKPELGTTLSGYAGLLLMGLSFVAMGIFISSLTENQIISAAISFGAGLLFWILRSTATITDHALGAVLRQLSILEHLESFVKGVVSLADLSFFVLFIVFFLFMSMRSLEAHRWRG